MLWRGMGDDEYQQAEQRGYFKSLGYRMRLSCPQHGKTFFTNACFAAAAYANEIAGWSFKPIFGKPAHVIGIPNPAPEPDPPQQHPLSRPNPALLAIRNWQEIGFDDQVPLSQMQIHYVGQPVAIIPGRFTFDGEQHYPQVTVTWEVANDIGY
jgi:hypothetical protein